MMLLTPTTETVPLRTDETGRMIYVGKTRVPLETVIYTYNEGASPEEIVRRYDALDISDVYLVIGYYLRHRAEVDAYITEADAHAEEMRRQQEPVTRAFYERLLARRKEREQG
jgi:uncharacterized protein (DUF433 family)